jgi:hypothetical protein
MSDPLRTESTPAPAPSIDVERDAKIESLLLGGLDHYFASEYGQAIDVWTRALFLDRQHARARAYIERARTALAEEQRESEELLRNGVKARSSVEIGRRCLLNAAVLRGGAREAAWRSLTRIDHQRRVMRRLRQRPRQLPPVPNVSVVAAAGSWRWASVLWLAVVLAGAVLVLASRDEVTAAIARFGSGTETDLTPAKSAEDPWFVPTTSEAAMERARSLFASGRLHDALRAVDLVRPADPLRGDADRLKAVIQRTLLAHQTLPGGGTWTEP